MNALIKNTAELSVALDYENIFNAVFTAFDCRGKSCGTSPYYGNINVHFHLYCNLS